MKKLSKSYFKNSAEYATFIAPKVLNNRLEKVVKGVDNTYFILKEDVCGEDCINAKSLIDYAILYCHVDIHDIPRNIRIEETSYFIMVMRISRYDFAKRFSYLKLYLDDIMSLDVNEYSKNKWYDVFSAYTDETLQQCIAESLEMTQDLRYKFMDFILNLPYEIRKKYYPIEV